MLMGSTLDTYSETYVSQLSQTVADNRWVASTFSSSQKIWLNKDSF